MNGACLEVKIFLCILLSVECIPYQILATLNVLMYASPLWPYLDLAFMYKFLQHNMLLRMALDEVIYEHNILYEKTELRIFFGDLYSLP